MVDCSFHVHDDPRWCDIHEAKWPDPTKPCEAWPYEFIVNRKDYEELVKAFKDCYNAIDGDIINVGYERYLEIMDIAKKYDS